MSRTIIALALTMVIWPGLAAAEPPLDAEILEVPQDWEVETEMTPLQAPPADEAAVPDSELFLDYLELDDSAAMAAEAHGTIIEKKLARWKDPFTLPQSKMVCVKWAKPWPGSKICVGHAYKWRWMYCEVRLVVTGPSIPGIGNAVNDCLRTGAVVAAAAGIAAAAGTAGAALPAAKAAFVTTFEVCLVAKVGSRVVGINLPQSCGWGGWQ